MTTTIGHNVDLAERAYRVRRNALRMGEVQGQGYIAQALDIADVQEILGIDVVGVIPESEGVLAASNAGVPVILDEGSNAGHAYEDAVARLLGESRPLRFIEANKKGLFARIFGS